MINDYAGYCATVGENKLHHLSGRATARNSLTVPPSSLLKKTGSVVLALSLLLGLSSTIWYSMRINRAIDTIGTTRAIQQELTEQQKVLTARRNGLDNQEYIRTAAAKLGLFPAADRQIRTP